MFIFLAFSGVLFIHGCRHNMGLNPEENNQQASDNNLPMFDTVSSLCPDWNCYKSFTELHKSVAAISPLQNPLSCGRCCVLPVIWSRHMCRDRQKNHQTTDQTKRFKVSSAFSVFFVFEKPCVSWAPHWLLGLKGSNCCPSFLSVPVSAWCEP